MFLGIKFIFLLLISPFIFLTVRYGAKNRFNKKGKIILSLFFLVIFLIITSIILNQVNKKIRLKKTDYYGEYIINRDFFKGKQANWQYNSFRFEIKQNDSIYFYVTEKEKILKTLKGKISSSSPNGSSRIQIHMIDSNHHILKSHPTTYRSTWSFYLVFYSEKFNNVYFKKGHWKPIND